MSDLTTTNDKISTRPRWKTRFLASIDKKKEEALKVLIQNELGRERVFPKELLLLIMDFTMILRWNNDPKKHGDGVEFVNDTEIRIKCKHVQQYALVMIDYCIRKEDSLFSYE
ncbi:hypothetical protein RFI_30737, partial [Reticulomyxa filosa]